MDDVITSIAVKQGAYFIEADTVFRISVGEVKVVGLVGTIRVVLEACYRCTVCVED